MSLSITGNVIEDENLGLTSLATDTDATDSDDNVTLSTFQSTISSSLGNRLTALGIYPDTTTNAGTGTTQAIGISEDTIVSTTDQNLKLTDSTGGALNGVDSGFKSIDGNEIYLFSDSSNPGIVLGRETNSTGTVAFALLLQPTNGGATIWVVQYEALTNTNPSVGEDANTLNLANLVYVSGSSSSTSSFNIGTKQPGQNYWLPFTSSSGTSTVIVTGLDASTSNPDTVNTSSGGDGSNSQSITPGGALRFDFVSSFTGGNTKDKTFLTDNSLNSLVYIEGTGASFDISQVTPTNSLVNLKIIAQNESAAIFGSTQTNTSTNTVALGEIDVYNSSGVLIASSTQTTGNHGITFGGTTSAPDGTVSGLTAGEKIAFTSLNGAQFDQFVVENILPPGNTPGFDILNVTETQTNTTTDTKEVGSHIIFEDSVPSASANTQTATVDEDALVGETTGETGFGGSATGNVSNLFNAGVDTPLTYRLAPLTPTQLAAALPALTSGGTAVTYSVASAGGIDTLTAKAGTTTVFTLALTESSGAYTFTLSAPIDQETPQNGSPEGTFSFDVSGLVQATDKDGNFGAGDTATAAANALTLKIIDDQPTASANTQTATVDEDALAGEATGETGFGGSATGNVSNLFNAGADVPLSYQLLNNTAGLPALTSGGVAVTYSVTSSGGIDTLTAKAGTTTVFTLALTESSGAYTFTLSAPIDQETPQNGSPEGTFSFDVSGLVQATDKDGSTVTAAANALTLTIIDDQPTTTTNKQTATVDEDALAGETTGETGFGGSATGNVSNLFNAGADVPLTYTLSGSTSGLPVLTSGGAAVTYSVTSAAGVDTLTAKAGATTVFTLALTEATGAYTFTLSAPIDQETPQNGSPEGTFSFDVSGLIHATDKDGSTVTAAASALSLTIIDDQPTFVANSSSSGSVDEDALSANLLPDATGASATATGSVSSVFKTGADAPLSFTLSTDTSKLPALTSHGTAITYSVTKSSGIDTLTAKAGTTTVFTMALTEATGAWSFTLSAPVDQAPGANDSSQTKLDFSSLILATDFDGSNATAPANAWAVTVVDDVPVNFNPEAIVSGDNVKDAAGSSFTGKLINTDAGDGTVDPNSSLTIEEHAGGDGFGALTFTGSNGSKLTGNLGGGSATNLQAGGADIYLFGFGTGTLTATTDSTGAGLPGGGSGSVITADEVFTITLDPNAGTYSYNMLQPISNGSNFTFSDFADVPAGNYAWFSLPFNPTTKQPVSPGKSVVFTGLNPGVDTVNPSSIGVGTDKQAVAPGKAIRLDFVDNVHSITSTTALKSLSTLSFLDHYEVNNAGFTLSQVSPTGKTVDIRLDAFDVPTSATTLQTTDTNQQKITEVKIVTEDSSGHITGTLADFTGDGTANFTNGGVSQSVTADFAPTGDSNGVDLQGVKLAPGEFILVSTATGFDRLLATNIGTVYNNKDSFDMGAVSVSTFNVGQPVNMAFNLALQDYDAFNSGLNSNLTEAGTGTLNINLTAPTA